MSRALIDEIEKRHGLSLTDDMADLVEDVYYRDAD